MFPCSYIWLCFWAWLFPGIRSVFCYSCDVTDFIFWCFESTPLSLLTVVFYLSLGFFTRVLKSSVLLTSDLPHGRFKKKEKHCLVSLEIKGLAWVVSISTVPQTPTPCWKHCFPFGVKPSSSDLFSCYEGVAFLSLSIKLIHRNSPFFICWWSGPNHLGSALTWSH